jgi:DNA polymerase sigma
LNWINPTLEERQLREQLTNKVFQLIHTCCGDTCRPVVFGSFATNLFLPNSDIDIVILDIEDTNKWFFKLADYLGVQPWVNKLLVISEARVSFIVRPFIIAMIDT